MGSVKRKTCKKGHPMRGKNVYQRANGQRECKACSRARVEAWRKRG